ncbi:MAG TPA: hypothetical protein VNK04_20405 [Gemmataceae bacterium]|nr:hypothetical protein [Gemmataceae bacterium]
MWVDDARGAEVVCSVCQAVVPDAPTPGPSAAAAALSPATADAGSARTGILVCPSGHRIWLDDDRGQKVICSVCSKVVREEMAPAEMEGPPSIPLGVGMPLPEDRPTRGLMAVRQGLAWHYARVLIHLLCIEAVMIGVILTTVADQFEAVKDLHNAVLTIAALVVTVVYFGLATALGIVGSVLCLGAPPEARARKFIAASIILDLVQVAVFLASEFLAPAGLLTVQPGEAAIDLTPLVQRTSYLVPALAAWAFFMVFLRRLALHLGEYPAADEARSLLGLGLLLGLIFLGVGSPVLLTALLTVLLLSGLLACLGLLVPIILIFVLVYAVLKFYLRLIALLGMLRQAIGAKVKVEVRLPG